MTIPSEALKQCSKCGEEKSLKEYYIRSTGKPHAHCKVCYKKNVYARKRGPNRERVLEMDRVALRKRRKNIKDEVFEAYGGYKCVCCGETEKLFLTIDHINNDGGEFRKKELGSRTRAGYHSYRWLLSNGCPPDVQVMCMNCQHGKRMNHGVCPHQGTCNDYPEKEYAQASGSAAPLEKG